MRTLIHLNGPPGVGKSTLAGVYAEAHPGALNLDIDVVASLIGGASEDFFAVVGQARRLALTMAGEHLRSGSDVVMPQLVMNPSEAQRFEAVARQTASNYLEIALVAQPDEQIRRLHQRSTAAYGTDPVDEAILADGRDGALRRSRQELRSTGPCVRPSPCSRPTMPTSPRHLPTCIRCWPVSLLRDFHGQQDDDSTNGAPRWVSLKSLGVPWPSSSRHLRAQRFLVLAGKRHGMGQSGQMDEPLWSHAQMCRWLDQVSVSEDVFVLCPEPALASWS